MTFTGNKMQSSFAKKFILLLAHICTKILGLTYKYKCIKLFMVQKQISEFEHEKGGHQEIG
jgi:hypothetical protein